MSIRGPVLFLILALAWATAGEARQFSFLRPLDASSPIGYTIADGRGHAGYQSSDRQLAIWAFEDWQRAAGRRFTLRPAPAGEALVQLNWADPTDGQYGEMQDIVVNGRHGAAVFIRPDVNGLGPGIASRANTDGLLRDTIVYLTCVHELGHALGLAHTRAYDDVMYFFGYGGDVAGYFSRYRAKIRTRRDIAVTSALSAGDVARLHALYPPP